ncbi:MAG: YigZ family protein [Propionicimonas sp.]|uniref:IMPACT family protein n=1 Tax=Propionicimonas sp. TaxID=1955623 RepID=UPI003D136B6F
MTTTLPSTIAGRVEHELVVKKSRFIATLQPVASVADAEAAIAALRRQYWDARHHCVALVVGHHAEQQRSSDDGEPSGTAGVPMLEVLRQRGMTDVVAVVTRYFGGVLLGVGGLVRAYSSAVSGALDVAAIVRREVLVEVGIDVPHGDAGRFENWLRDWASGHGAVLGEPAWADVARFAVLVPPAALASLTEDAAAFSAGALVPVRGAERIVDLP